MLLSELIKKLETAKSKFGDMDVLVESRDDVNINHVFRVVDHIRITDADKEWMEELVYQEIEAGIYSKEDEDDIEEI